MSEDITYILHTLDSATGLRWSPPPAQPSFLRNGYHTEVRQIDAPYLVRRLQAAAVRSTGRPRAIMFQTCGSGMAIVNIPREVVEGLWFRQALFSPDAPNFMPSCAPDSVHPPVIPLS